MFSTRLFVTIAALSACLPACGSASGGDSSAKADSSLAQGVPATGESGVPKERNSPPVNSDRPAPSECGADKLGRWMNMLVTETVKQDIRAAVGHDRIRYIAPGTMVTMDFLPNRLNVETGEDGRIKLFRCG